MTLVTYNIRPLCKSFPGKAFANVINVTWAASSEFESSSIPSWQILTAHAQSFRGARDLDFCMKVPLDPLLAWASSGGSGETARMRRLAWTFAARIGDKYQIRLTRPTYSTCTWWTVHLIRNRCYRCTAKYVTDTFSEYVSHLLKKIIWEF